MVTNVAHHFNNRRREEDKVVGTVEVLACLPQNNIPPEIVSGAIWNMK